MSHVAWEYQEMMVVEGQDADGSASFVALKECQGDHTSNQMARTLPQGSSPIQSNGTRESEAHDNIQPASSTTQESDRSIAPGTLCEVKIVDTVYDPSTRSWTEKVQTSQKDEDAFASYVFIVNRRFVLDPRLGRANHHSGIPNSQFVAQERRERGYWRQAGDLLDGATIGYRAGNSSSIYPRSRPSPFLSGQEDPEIRGRENYDFTSHAFSRIPEDQLR